MTQAIVYIGIDEAITTNKLFSSGGVRDQNALLSAIGEPQQGAFGQDFHPGIDDKAAALFRGLARNHAFVDGNKRTALYVTGAFLGVNGFNVATEPNKLLQLTLDVAQGHVDLPEIAARLGSWRVPVVDLRPSPTPSPVHTLGLL